MANPYSLVLRPLLTERSTFLKERLNQYTFEVVLNACKGEINCRSRGIVPDRNRLYWEDFKSMLVPFPTPAEQTRVVAYIDSGTDQLNISASRAQHQIDLMREYRTRLIADVVTGKLDVRGVELPELDGEEVLEDWDEGAEEEEANEIAETGEIALADV